MSKNISVTAETFAKIKHLAAEQSVSMRAFVDDRVTQYLNRKGWQ